MEMTPEDTITEVTRRAIVDYLSVGRHWSGALAEDEFLGRLYDLNRMPSTDTRWQYDTAAKDIRQHRVNNLDWSDDWVFTDGRFNLLHSPDEPFLKFLAETVHPLVRPDSSEARAMVAEYNTALGVDGWEIDQIKSISNKPVFGYRRRLEVPHFDEATRMADRLSGTYVAQQIRRMREAAESDPDLVIGTAKEFLETICKTILVERGVSLNNDDFPQLVRSTIKALTILPPEVSNEPQLKDTITVLLGNLGSVGHRLAELRNQSGTGHGRHAGHVGLTTRHAKLAIGAAATLAVFLYECHESASRS
jgi:hypothetical protein